MHALRSSMIETGFAPAPELLRHTARAAPDPGPWQDAPGELVRHMLRAIASERGASGGRQGWRLRVRRLVEREQARLQALVEADGLAEAFERGRARVADGAVVGLLHLARAELPAAGPATVVAPLSILALGAYGRSALAPGAALDLLFLMAPWADERGQAERLTELVLAGLRDLGLEAGHATRTLQECRDLAASEPAVLASLLEARFLAGSFSLYGMLEAELKQLAGASAVPPSLKVAG